MKLSWSLSLLLVLIVVAAVAQNCAAERATTPAATQPSKVPGIQYACQGALCDRVIDSMKAAVETNAAPAMAAAAANASGTLFLGVAGRYTYDSSTSLVTNNTQFDMASCTKVMATTTATAMLYQRGLLSLTELVSSPGLLGFYFAAHGKGSITVENLLLHNAGYPPDPNPGYSSPLFPCPENYEYHPGQAFSCDEIIYDDLLRNQGLVYPTGTKYVYSDLSMITLMFVVGKVVRDHKLVSPANFPLNCRNSSSLVCNFNAYVQNEIFEPLGMKSTQYIPTNPLRTVPEWHDPWYHHGQIVGYVSDQNAYALGGISGHAGVFSTVEDTMKFMKMWMFDTQPHRLNTSTRDLFIKVHNLTQSTRALGWDTHGPGSSSCGTLSAKTFLHIGFTGTQVCGDPENGAFTVLLANGRYPNFYRDGMVGYRPIYNTLIHDLLGW